MIKLAVFLALVALSYSYSETKPIPIFLETAANSCMLEHGIVNETLISLDQRLDSGIELPMIEKCFYKCILQRIDFMDYAGNLTPVEGIHFIANQVNQEVPESRVDRVATVMNKCQFSETEDLCERAVQITKCLETIIYYL